MLRILIVSACLLSTVLGHSWLTCTDYLEQNGFVFNPNLCRAAPRHGWQYAPKTSVHGTDTKYDYINVTEYQPCRTARDDFGAYTADHPMAVYFPGQKVILTHPAKSHCADVRCTTKNIPDYGNKLYYGFKDGGADPSFTEFMQREIADFGASPFGDDVPDEEFTTYPKRGFMNAPGFCDNKDGALGSFTWNLPEDIEPGQYTFMWVWHFKSAAHKDGYSSCFDARIVEDRAARDRILNERGQSTADPVDAIQGPGTPTPPPGVTGVPIDGGWSEWSDWADCSKECGSGEQKRTRFCDNPLPENGGRYCEGPNEESRPCNTHECPPSGFRFRFTSEWESGANGEIYLPVPKPATDRFEIKIIWPCALTSHLVWNSDDVSLPEEVAVGTYRARQTEWQLEKETIGLTAHFQAPCQPKEGDVKLEVV